jgi:dienelactone hydrolase
MSNPQHRQRFDSPLQSTLRRIRQLAYRRCRLSGIVLGSMLCLTLLGGTNLEFDLPVGPLTPPPAVNPEPLPGTSLLDWNEDLSNKMLLGIDEFLTRLTRETAANRTRLWKRDFSSRDAYEKSVQPNRDRLRRMLGVVDHRVPDPRLQFATLGPQVLKIAENDHFIAYEVRWPVLAGVQGEGLLLEPKTGPVARLVALPDADQTPEVIAGLAPGVASESQFARRLAESGCQVLIPTLIDRSDAASGSPKLKRFTNQPHREWIYRQAYVMGRHIIGYEIQKIMAALDCLAALNPANDPIAPQLGLAGYGEGALLALYTAALDPRIEATLVSGYFAPREGLWQEPIYRNVFGLLSEFGDAELASLVAPRTLIVEHSQVPDVQGPPPSREGRRGAAPGRLVTPDRHAAEAEVNRARAFFPTNRPFPLAFISGGDGNPTPFGSALSLQTLLEGLATTAVPAPVPGALLTDSRPDFNPDARQRRQVDELVRYTQDLVRGADAARNEFFWSQLKVERTTDWNLAVKDYRRYFHEEVIGRLPGPSVGANPRSRKIHERARWNGYEVVLDVWPDVFTWAYVLLPTDLRPGDRRPVVVCQHGLEGLPEDTIAGPGDSGYNAYKAFAARLADRGFIVVAPHNPYRGGDRFRALQRKANPLKQSLFSVIIGQHERLLQWLMVQPWTDPKRIGFYGLSYGGKTAMRVPAVLENYALSICSADFNEWIWKNALVDSPYSYLYTGEYEMPEFNLGNTFNYAEMAALIAPRPFMVERGHDDPVAPDEWVAHEYAKVRRFYTRLAYPERTNIEFFDGPHTIHGVGTFQFLYRHLDFTRR